MYKALLADADMTLFDFIRSEKAAFANLIKDFSIQSGDRLFSRYHDINGSLWDKYEKGEITQAGLRIERFRMLIDEFGLGLDAHEVSEGYIKRLGEGSFLLPGAKEFVVEVSKAMPVVLVTNGISEVQRSRLARSEIAPYISDIVVSGDVGAAKPDPEILRVALSRLKLDKKDAVMLGDSLKSDIAAANNIGMDSIWLSPSGKAADGAILPKYTVTSLSEVLPILGIGA
ncbi:MAG: YjjG family noncanonical pyrimidine nucleotidase [Eubacteriales bacterium]|nr:YjjG family noncanonical pyrimidine nucleotidase [Eubacteriales bacterium]MDD3881250.1 YjjG family noncanonical pyrimidine nucleotidase [Eubacteriales bacterium]MDD4512168.1 YjjG family noncanonical pyrimidine nucleotidase [Eubacteriales bacterium]